MIKIILKENKKLLNEITMEQALSTLNSKATRKMMYKYVKQEKLETFQKAKQKIPHMSDEAILNQFLNKTLEPSEESINNRIAQLMDNIHRTIPRDLTDEQKALSVLWLKRELTNSYLEYNKVFVRNEFMNGENAFYKRALENFFQRQRFIEPPEKRDLNQVSNFRELASLNSRAQSMYQAYQEKQSYLDADKGTEFLGEKQFYKVYIAHNKGAACELGKNTFWCTAARGLNFFDQYSKEDDPLFIFVSTKNPSEKFQFHYGLKEFKDAHNEPIEQKDYLYLHNLLLSFPGIEKKYPIIVNYKK